MSAANARGSWRPFDSFVSFISTHPQAVLQSDQSIANAGLYGRYGSVELFGDFPVREPAVVGKPHGLLLGFRQRPQAPHHGFGFEPVVHFVGHRIVVDVLVPRTVSGLAVTG